MDLLESIWIAAEAAVVAGDVATLERLLREHEDIFRGRRPQSSWLGGLAPDYTSADAGAILVREHHFANREVLAGHLEALRQGHPTVVVFETAVDAVVAGDEAALRRMFAEHPELVRGRSPRTHHATLLHYVGANGVESWRQRTPANAVKIARMLLQAGAEVDALADLYGGSTPLGLVATSIHPLRVGVQNELIEAFLSHGAAMDHPQGAGNGQGLVNGCLANGRSGAARFLADRGARLDLESAAGVGRLEVVRRFFDDEGRLQANATVEQMKSGLQWAGEYGHAHVVGFLLARGVAAGELHRGRTVLHWAAYGGHADIVKLLLERKVPVNLKDQHFKSTPLGWALHGWANPPGDVGASNRHVEVVASLVAAGATVDPEGVPHPKRVTDPRMTAALRGEMPAN